MDFEKLLIYTFNRITNNFRYNFELKINQIGLHGGQVFILLALWKNNGQSQIELAKELNLSAPTVFKMIDSLIKGGFVECNKCQKDKRMMRVYLTEKGIEYQKSVEEKFVEFENEFFSDLTDTEKLIFLQICEKLTGNSSAAKSLSRTV